MPLSTQTVAVLKVWLRERGGQSGDPVLPTRLGPQLSPDAVETLVAEHTRTAARSCPSLQIKKIAPYVLRHTNAMQLLQSGVDSATIALWLGHKRVQTTDTYVHADRSMTEKALTRLTPPSTPPGRYRASDALMSFLVGP